MSTKKNKKSQEKPQEDDELTEKTICPNCGSEVSIYLKKCHCGFCLSCSA